MTGMKMIDWVSSFDVGDCVVLHLIREGGKSKSKSKRVAPLKRMLLLPIPFDDARYDQ
jgi:hypothetical protein